MKKPIRRFIRWLRWPAALLALVLLFLLGPLGMLAFGGLDLDTHWSRAERDSAGLAPDPSQEPEALVQVYGARAYNWRGAFGIHTWIAVKPRRASSYTLYQVIGWNLYRGRSTVTKRRVPRPDLAWFNAPPQLLAERRGAGVPDMIARVEKAVREYPYSRRYRVWPGPNSNTFMAYIARRIPELGLDLPPNAIGKDYLVGGRIADRMPSGTGWQISLLGLLGVGLAWEEGIELNLLGLSAGIDVNDLALRLPGVGKVGAPDPGFLRLD